MILHVITGLSTGGAERALYNVLAGGLGRQYKTAVLSLQGEGSIGPQIRELEVPVYQLNMHRGMPTPSTVMRLRQVVHEFRPDIIQGWMYHGNLAASLAGCLAPGHPAVAWNVRHSLYDLAAEKPLTRQVIRVNRLLSNRKDAIIYNSRLSRSQHETFGFDTSVSLVIPNGFDLEQLRPNEETGTMVRQELAIPEDALVVGHVARFHPMKDHASFLRAAVRVALQMPNARFLLIGREVSPENPALSDIVSQELLERFVFLGERQDVYTLMQAMDVLSSSSWGEAFPNVIGEAMACQVPCVVTDVGDSADIVGNTGIVVPPSDSAALTKGLLIMLKKPAEKRRALGRAARVRIKANYELKTVVGQYARFYNELAGRG